MHCQAKAGLADPNTSIRVSPKPSPNRPPDSSKIRQIELIAVFPPRIAIDWATRAF